MNLLSVDRSIRHWWVFVLRGALFILVGIYMVANPATSFVALGFVFGLIILLAGVTELLRVVRDKDAGSRSWHLMLGIVDIILGIVLMGHVATSVAILRIIVGFWFLFRGISLFSFSRITGGSVLLTIGAVLNIIFALMIIFNAVFGSLTIIIFIAIAFIITGLMNVWLGYRLK
ncbi:HdeD family acid-resistance protein [Mucilaginibacter sp.]|uniref:HdeD family acid-resistance protein n=1 Tax=Mucilaginibacter sp. TaxID=1882438 RepID=UPI003D111E8F